MAFRFDASTLPIWIIVGWVTTFLVGVDLFVVSTFLPLIGKEVGRSPQSLTVLVSAFGLAYAVACPIQGRIAERFSPKAVLIFGLSALAFANVCTALAPDLVQLIISRVMAGIAAASISPMIYNLTANSAAPGRLASSLAIVNSGLILSLILGAPVGLLLGSITEWRYVFLGLAAMLAVMLPINQMSWPQPVACESKRAVAVKERLVDAWPFLACMVAWAASVYMTYTLLGVALETRLHLDVWAVSLELSTFGLGAMIGVLSGGRLADRLGARRVIYISFVAMVAMFCVSAVVFDLEAPTLFALGLFFIGWSAYGFFPAIQATAASVFVARRSTVLGFMSSSLYIGITLGSFFGGMIFNMSGMTLVLIASAIVASFGMAIVVALPKR